MTVTENYQKYNDIIVFNGQGLNAWAFSVFAEYSILYLYCFGRKESEKPTKK